MIQKPSLWRASQIQYLSVGAAAADEYGLIRHEVPPLPSVLEDLLQNPHLNGTRGVERRFPSRQHLPTIVVPISVMATSQIRKCVRPDVESRVV